MGKSRILKNFASLTPKLFFQQLLKLTNAVARNLRPFESPSKFKVVSKIVGKLFVAIVVPVAAIVAIVVPVAAIVDIVS